METMDRYGAWQRRQRKVVLGLTQADLADLVYCSKGMIAKIEAGQRRPAKELAERLITELRVSPADREKYVAWARGLSLSEPAELPAGVAHLAGGMVRLSHPVEGHRDWVLMPLEAVTAARLSLPCTGTDCNGKDPEVTGCAAPSFTVEQLDITSPVTGERIATIELRFSRVCQTNWARVTKLTGGTERLKAYLRNDSGEIIEETRAESGPAAVYVYGPMWYAPTGEIAVRACGVIEGHDEVCMNLH